MRNNRQKQESFDSLRANLYLAAKPSNLTGWRSRGLGGGRRGVGGMGGRGLEGEAGAQSSGWLPSAQPPLVVVLVLVLVVLTEVEVLVGGGGHPHDQEHHFTKTQLLVLVAIEVPEDLVDRGLILHVLQEKSQSAIGHSLEVPRI